MSRIYGDQGYLRALPCKAIWRRALRIKCCAFLVSLSLSASPQTFLGDEGGLSALGKAKGAPLRQVDLVADIEYRLIEEEFEGDVPAAVAYVGELIDAAAVVIERDLGLELRSCVIVPWDAPAPFEINADTDPFISDTLGAYGEFVNDQRAEASVHLHQLFGLRLPSYSGVPGLSFVSKPCDGYSVNAIRLDATFPLEEGSIDVIMTARNIARNLGAATAYPDSIMATTFSTQTPLVYAPETITEVTAFLADRPCPFYQECGFFPAGEGEGEAPPHTGDQNGDGIVSLSELLRVIQFFNTGGLHCAASPGATEDGFVPGANAAAQSCTPHASDYNPQDWVISLSELLRLIQFFNSGGYFACESGEDGYCPSAP